MNILLAANSLIEDIIHGEFYFYCTSVFYAHTTYINPIEIEYVIPNKGTFLLIKYL